MKEDSQTTARQPIGRGVRGGGRILATALLSLSIFFVLGAISGSHTRTPGAVSVPPEPEAQPQQQETFSGTWTADVKTDKSDDAIQFTFNRRARDGHTSMSGHGYSLDDFQGLTRAQVFAAVNTPVTFRLTREAGTVECEGSFRDGKGAGTWRMVASRNFRSAMSARGYTDLTDEQLFTSVMVDVTTKFVDDFKSIGFDGADFKEVIKGRIFNITPQYASEMKSLGFDNLDLEDLVKGRIFKVDAEFVRQVQAMGFDKQSLEGLVKLRIFKITPEFISEMKSADFENLTTEELVKLRIFEISPAFVKSLKAEGLSELSVEDAVKLRIHHVDDNFIRRARANGYTNLDVEDLVRLSIHGMVK
jgi:predicted metallopeptidase